MLITKYFYTAVIITWLSTKLYQIPYCINKNGVASTLE